MRIQRDHSRGIFRQRRRGGGCLTLFMTLALLMVVAFFGRDRITEWFWSWIAPPIEIATLQDAYAAFQQGDLERSINYARQLYENNPDDIDALVFLARVLIYRSYSDVNLELDRQQALSLTGHALRQYPLDMRVLGIHAFVQQANGFSGDAGRVALRVIRSDSESITARLALSLSYGSRGLFEAALREGERAVEIAAQSAPNWKADAYRVLAIAYSDFGNYEAAAQAVELAINFNRRLLPLHFERALYAMQIGDMDTATAYYFNVIAFDDENVKARFRLCELSSTLREREAAIDWCNQVTQSAPGWSDGWYQLGREYYLQGDFQQAQTALNRCSTLQVAQNVSIEERRFECWYLQGQAAEVMRDCEGLIALYEEYQQMAGKANLEQTWLYPPGGPTICATPSPVPAG
jgi:tetratricopeptide (TPR) repeat protein